LRLGGGPAAGLMDASQIVIDEAAACPSTGLLTRGDDVHEKMILAELEARSKRIAHWAFGYYFEKAGGCALDVIDSKDVSNGFVW